MTIVRAFPRLHFGLADLGRATLRAYGGAGVQLSGPYIDIEAVVEPTATLSGFERLEARGQADLAAAIRRLEAAVPDGPSFRVTLLTEIHEHVGLGSKTAMTLGALQAAAIAGEVDVSRSEIQLLSGRGGASGVGVHAFFDGGFVMDAGHRQREVTALHPSAARRPTSAPLLVNRLEVPANWRFCLVLPAGKRLSGKDETGFFDSATPVPVEEVRATLALLHHGIGPAFATGDMQALAESLDALQRCGFKSKEIAAQPASVQALMEECRHFGPTGLSSMGPLVFVVVDSVAKEHEVRRVIARVDAADLGTWSARSKGFEVLR
jgi:beta-ribofuranosylaminobenzene 5'-phosphate synthase